MAVKLSELASRIDPDAPVMSGTIPGAVYLIPLPESDLWLFVHTTRKRRALLLPLSSLEQLCAPRKVPVPMNEEQVKRREELDYIVRLSRSITTPKDKLSSIEKVFQFDEATMESIRATMASYVWAFDA